jgi:hypothetical protein
VSASLLAICSKDKALTLAAASSIASGMPSSLRQISTIQTAFSGPREKAEPRSLARSTNSRTDS